MLIINSNNSFFWQLLLACLLTSESAHIPYKGFMKDLDELVESKYFFRPQEQCKCRIKSSSNCWLGTGVGEHVDLP